MTKDKRDADSLEEKVGASRDGVKRGSRFLPLVILGFVVIVFLAHVDPFEPEIRLGGSRTDRPTDTVERWVIPETAQDTLVIMLPPSGSGDIRSISRDALLEFRGSEVGAALAQLEQLLDPLRAAGTLSPADKDEVYEQLIDVLGPSFDAPGSTSFGQSLVSALNRGAANIEAFVLHDTPLLLRAQLSKLGLLVLFSLLPGFFGMIYRRAFARWFLASFAVLLAMNWLADIVGQGTITSAVTAELSDQSSVQTFLTIEVIVVLGLILYRLRGHAPPPADSAARKRAIVWGIAGLILTVVAARGVQLAWGNPSTGPMETLLAMVVVALLGSVTFLFFKRALSPAQGTPKNIAICLDGTWNQPGQTDFGYLSETNVFKLYDSLKVDEGKSAVVARHASRSKRYTGLDGETKQVAFYYNGVGNSVENSQLGQLLGGGLGMGAVAIVERAYLDLVAAYRPGDRIFIFGFSRGAAIARLLAGSIDSRGMPEAVWTLSVFGRPWVLWRSKRALAIPIEVLACWDTVGAFGLSKNMFGIPFQKINLLKDLKIPLCVKQAYHMLALDETRDIFEPTLMHPDPTRPHRIKEVWFSGNHANVGGGYATDGLSDITLDFLLRQVSSGYAPCTQESEGEAPSVGDESWGLYLEARCQPGGTGRGLLDPDPTGRLRRETGAVYADVPRPLPLHAVIHDSVFERMRTAREVYAPESLFELNKKLRLKRDALAEDFADLIATKSLTQDEQGAGERLSTEYLRVMRWSETTESVAGSRGNGLHDPRVALKNPWGQGGTVSQPPLPP